MAGDSVTKMSNVLIIIPAYNEEEAIANTVQAVIEHTDCDYIVVNDGSTDQTEEIVQSNNFSYISLPVNLGIGGAMQTGYKYALKEGYEYAIQLDADGQHDPRDLHVLTDAIQTGDADMVVGSRFVEKSGYKGSAGRRLGIYYFSVMLRVLSNIQIKDPTSGYRIVNRKVIQEFAKHYPVDYPEVEVLADLAKKGFTIKEVKVEMQERQGGVSSITAKKSIYYMVKVTFFCMIRRFFSKR